MILETERLILRDWREGDVDELIALKSDSQVMEHFFPARIPRKKHANIS